MVDRVDRVGRIGGQSRPCDRAERDRPVSLALHGDRIAGLTICKVGVQMVTLLRKHEKMPNRGTGELD